MKAPIFELQDMNGEIYSLEDDLGNNVVLTFWTSWCPDSGRDLPKKEQLFQSMDHDKVKMITINVVGRERNAQEGIDYANKFLTQPILFDKGTEIYDAYNCQGVPTTVLINRNGEIVKQFGDQAQFLEIVEAIGSKLV
ncbi:redoxin domain-containing protein [Pontibacillus yanchengensis]|uniref:Redoxin domain-containing protein n=2 Tax=Pontibacillus yanchengensis TaxID=462910 RepID=A0ACC7VK89_9BACI|nr:TlpA disulfide reductase family protein [Pontibacillus yanchengensis]MYL33716.1 redoxin domain-containing protein [Pontibacillus yanchengensis]MYL55386.1 redoxin domain-containing protein [Pontibacillus yanchengensis]